MADNNTDRKNPDSTNGTPTLPAELRIAIQSEVEKELGKQLAIVKEWSQIGLKIVATAFAFLLAIFTVFGLTTWKDIKSETAKEVKEQAEALIKQRDSDIGVQQTLTDLVNKATVASALIALKSESASSNLGKGDWDRLTSWIRKENLSTEDFTAVLRLLNSQSEDRKKHDANAFLADMVLAQTNSDYSWLRKQPDKRLAILETFLHVDIGSSAQKVAVSTDESDELRSAALDYIQEVGYADAIAAAITLANKLEPGDLRTKALAVAGTLNPANPAFMAAATQLMVAKPDSGQIHVAIEVLVNIWRKRSYDVDSLARPEVLKLSEDLLNYVLANGGQMEIREMPSGFGRNQGMRENMSVVFWPPSSGSRTFGTILSPADFAELKPYWEVLKEYSAAGDFQMLAHAWPRTTAFALRDVYFHVSVPDAAEISVTIESDKTTKMISAKDYVDFRALLVEPKEGLKLYWRQRNGDPNGSTGFTTDTKNKGLSFSSSLLDGRGQ